MPTSSRSFWRSPLAFVGLAALCALTLLFRLGSYGLVDPDEGRYAEIPREMLARGDWVTPTVNGIKFFDKPVLTYWSVMATYRVLGVSEFAARLALVVFAFAGIAATYALGRRAFGARAGLLGAAMLSTTIMWPVMGRFVITDTPLASMTTCALAFWWLGHTTCKGHEQQREGAPLSQPSSETPVERGAKPRFDNRVPNFWFAGFWICLGLGVLSKGPVAVVLCFGAIIPYLLWCRPRNGWKMGLSWGIPLMLLVAAPWFIEVQMRNSEFNHLFWYKQNFQRFTGGAGVPDHWEAPYFLLPFLPAIFFPWSVFFPRALVRLPAVFRRARVEPDDQRARATVLLVFGAVFTLLFFSASKSKIVTYILPMLPLGCACLGAWFDARWTRRDGFKAEALVLGLLAVVLGVAALVSRSRVEKLLGGEAVPIWLVVAGVMALLWSLALLFAAFREKTREVFGATAGGFALLLAATMMLWSSIEGAVTLRAMMQPVRQAMTNDTQIASIGYAQSLSYYSGRRVILGGGDPGSDQTSIPRELQPGWERMPAAERAAFFYRNADELKRIVARPHPVFVVARSKVFQDPRWQSLAPQVQLLNSNSRYSLYGNPAATARYRATLSAHSFNKHGGT